MSLYPVPYLATVLLLSGISIIGLASLFSGWERPALILCAGAMFATAMFSVVWSVIARPELLKSERYVLLERMINGMGDSDMDVAARERLQSQMISSLSERPLRIGRNDPKKIMRDGDNA